MPTASAAAASTAPTTTSAGPSLGIAIGTSDSYLARQRAQAQRVAEDARIAEQSFKHLVSSSRVAINRAEKNAVTVSQRMTSCCVLGDKPCQLPGVQAQGQAQRQAQVEAQAARAASAKRSLSHTGPEIVHDSEEDELTEDEAEMNGRAAHGRAAQARSPTNASRVAYAREANFGGAELAKRVCTRDLP